MRSTSGSRSSTSRTCRRSRSRSPGARCSRSSWSTCCPTPGSTHRTNVSSPARWSVGYARLRRRDHARHRGRRLAAGGWTIMLTVGRRIYHVHPVDGLCSQGASAAVILAPRALGGRSPDGSRVARDDAGERRDRSDRAARLAVGVMSRRHWFLPNAPDVLGLLRRQVDLTGRGMDAFADWAARGGDTHAAATVRALEHEATPSSASCARRRHRHDGRAARRVRAPHRRRRGADRRALT